MSSRVDAVFEAQNPQELSARYDEWAASYEDDMDDHGGPQEAAEVLTRYVAPAARILDAGCGTGLAGQILAARGYRQLEGLDLSVGMLREAGNKGCYNTLHQQTLGEALDFPSAMFDAVLSVGVFVRAHAPSRSLAELIRITKPGGYIIFTLAQTALAEAGRWRLVETTEPFDGRYKHSPGITMQVWVYEVLRNA